MNYFIPYHCLSFTIQLIPRHSTHNPEELKLKTKTKKQLVIEKSKGCLH